MHNLVVLYARQGRYDEAEPLLAQLVELGSHVLGDHNPDMWSTYVYRGMLYYQRGEYDKAWSDVRRAQSLGHEIPSDFLQTLRRASATQDQKDSNGNHESEDHSLQNADEK